MKTIYHFLFFSLWICLWMVGCSDKGEPIVDEPVVVPTITLSGAGSCTFASSGGTETLSFTSTQPWTASSGQNWCKVSPSSGAAGTCNVTISVEENATFDERNTSVVIQSGTQKKSVTVTQKQKDALTVTSGKLELPADGGIAKIEVKANVSFVCEVEEGASEWISVVSSRSLPSSVVELQIAKNEELAKREGKLVIRGGDMEETVTVYQEGATPAIVLSQNEYTVGSDSDTLTIQLKSNVEYQMIVPEEESWLQIVESRAFSDYTHYIQVATNDTYGARYAEIHFVNEEMELDETVKVVQVQNDAIVVAQDEYILDAVTTRLDFEVNANVEFEVAVSVDWIQAKTESRALTAYPLSFVIDENVEVEPREGVISLTYGELKQDIRIVQNGRVDYGLLSVTHSHWNFLVPKITGRYLKGVVRWGDDSEETYTETLFHPYASEKTYTLQIDVWGAEEVEFHNLMGIEEIDVSAF